MSNLEQSIRIFSKLHYSSFLKQILYIIKKPLTYNLKRGFKHEKKDYNIRTFYFVKL
jgi:hypothetical protein